MGPPETKITGMLMRRAAIGIPGRTDLVAVRDADHGVGAVGVDHVLHRVGDEFAGRQGIEHATVAHGDAVIHGDGVELLRDPASRLDFAGDQLAQILGGGRGPARTG
jgi:hypothetical protein